MQELKKRLVFPKHATNLTSITLFSECRLNSCRTKHFMGGILDSHLGRLYTSRGDLNVDVHVSIATGCACALYTFTILILMCLTTMTLIAMTNIVIALFSFTFCQINILLLRFFVRKSHSFCK